MRTRTLNTLFITFKLVRKRMDREQIKRNAGIIYKALKDGKAVNYGQLKEITGLRDRELNAAIGWLSQEDKIQFDNSAEKIELSIVKLLNTTYYS